MEKRSQGANKCFIFFFSNDSKVRPGNTSLPTATKISMVHLSLSASGVLVALNGNVLSGRGGRRQ